MIRLQLRTPQDKKIRDLVTELSQTLLESLRRELDCFELPADLYHLMEPPLMEAMSPYLNAYDACGKDPVCTEEIKSVSLPDANDRIYTLWLPDGTDGLIQSLCATVLDHVGPYLNPETLSSLERRMRSSLLRTLGEYVYRNPVCGKHEICFLSRPVNPWSDPLPH